MFYGSRIPQAIVDRHGSFMECNAAFASFFGYTPTELIGTPFARYTHPEDVDADLKAVSELLAGANGVSHYEMHKRYLHKIDGHECWFRLIVDAVWTPDPDGGGHRFSHFFVVALPLPNGGKFRTRKDDDGTVTVRPSVDIVELVKDNKAAAAAFVVVMALLNPKVYDLLMAFLK